MFFSFSRHYGNNQSLNGQKKKKQKKGKGQDSGHRWAITGCYDGQIRLWNIAENNTMESLGSASGHSSAIKAVHFLDSQRLVSASKDSTLRFWQLSSGFNLDESKSDNVQINNYAIGKGHDDAVECLSVCPPADPDLPLDEDESNQTSRIKVVSGGWDKKILLWNIGSKNTSHEESGDQPMEIETETSDESKKKKKKRKLPQENEKEDKNQENTPWKRKTGTKLLALSPISSLEGHTQCVSAVCWASHSASALYSGSWDHSIFLWDTSQAKAISTWNGRAVVSGMDFSLMANLLATSHHDQTIRLWDPRQKELEVLKMALRSHKGWCSSVAWSESNPRVFASTSYDKSIKLWDIRSTTPIHTIQAHTDKVLSIKHVKKDTWLSGGADRQLRLHSL